jgi:hypothetical protein
MLNVEVLSAISTKSRLFGNLPKTSIRYRLVVRIERPLDKPGSVLTLLPTVGASSRLMERIESPSGDPD